METFYIHTIYTLSMVRQKKTFCGFSMGRNQYLAGRVYDLCVYYMTGTPEGSTESGFMEKPGMVRQWLQDLTVSYKLI